MAIIKAANFHPMRGDVADGNVVIFSDGSQATIKGTMRGWVLVECGQETGWYDAFALTRAIVAREGQEHSCDGDKQ